MSTHASFTGVRRVTINRHPIIGACLGILSHVDVGDIAVEIKKVCET